MSIQLRKIISGGQTGADRAALDIGRRLGYLTGGYVPKGRLAEDGRIPDDYLGLVETDQEDPAVRTEANILFSDGTLVVSHGQVAKGSGTELTLNLLVRAQKPHLHINFTRTGIDEGASIARAWIDRNRVQTLNVAGPRALEDEVIYTHTCELLTQLLLVPQTRCNQVTADTEAGEDLALAVYEQGMENWRHWDTIRWLVPSWYYTFSGAVATFATQKVGALRAAACMIVVFGVLSIILLLRLDHYHRKSLAQTNESLKGLLKPGEKLAATTKALPFSLTGWRYLTTATFWHQLAIALLIGSSLVVALNWGEWATGLATFLVTGTTAASNR